MHRSKGFIGAALLALALVPRAPAQPLADPQTEKKIDALLAQMTLEEKVGQLNQYSNPLDLTGPAAAAGHQKAAYDQIRSGLVGSMLNVNGAEATRKAQQLARRGQPAEDPDDLRLRRDPRLQDDLPGAARRGGQLGPRRRSSARRASPPSRRPRPASTGPSRRWSTSPATPAGAGSWRAPARTPTSARASPAARVRGFQGKDLEALDTIAACAKHYAAYGFAEAGRDYNTVDISEQTLRNVILPPFKAAADAGAATFMNSFNEIGGIPATGSVHLQRDILKGEWGFEGFVVSDWGSIGEMIPHGYAEDLEHAAQHRAHGRQRHGHGVARLRRPPRRARQGRQGRREARRRRGPPRAARQVRARPVRRPVPLLGRSAREGGDDDARAPRRRARRGAASRSCCSRTRAACCRSTKTVKQIAVIGPLAARQGHAARQLARPGDHRLRRLAARGHPGGRPADDEGRLRGGREARHRPSGTS